MAVKCQVYVFLANQSVVNIALSIAEHTILLVEMFNIVGERERPNLGFARDVGAA